MANSTPRRICVTGATGRAGRVVVRHLAEHGYDVVATDAVVAAHEARAGVIQADLTDFGQAAEVLHGTAAVVHLASIPAPGRMTPAITFSANVAMNFNVFHAAASLGLSRVVWTSGESTLGVPFGTGKRTAQRTGERAGLDGGGTPDSLDPGQRGQSVKGRRQLLLDLGRRGVHLGEGRASFTTASPCPAGAVAARRPRRGRSSLGGAC